MEVLLLLVMGIVNIVCFFVGAKVGQTVSKGEKIEVPNMNPVEAVREYQEKKEARQQQSRIETIMTNMEVYNGTSVGQKDVPRR